MYRYVHLIFSAFLGEVGSGKSEATRLLRREFRYAQVNTGQLMAQLLGIKPVPETPRDKFQRQAWKYISRPGAQEKFAEIIWERVQQIDRPRIIIDGIRQRKTLDHLRFLAGDRSLGVLYVRTLPDLAFQFFRSREGRGISFPDFLKLRSAPVEQEVEAMIGSADAVLYNWIGRKEYQTAIRELFIAATQETRA